MSATPRTHASLSARLPLVLGAILAFVAQSLPAATRRPGVRSLAGGLRSQTQQGADAPASPAGLASADPEQIPKDLLRAARRSPGVLPLQAAAADDGPFPVACEGASLNLDAFGAFGASSEGSDATFHGPAGSAGTVFESMLWIRGVGFLDADSLLQPQSDAHAARAGGSVVAHYGERAWDIAVSSQLEDCGSAQATLVERWTIRNAGAAAADLKLASYLDGDLLFAGDEHDDHGAIAGDQLVQFDLGRDAGPSAFVALSSSAPAAVRSAREIGEFSEMRRRLSRGGFLLDRIARADGRPADLDHDGVTDEGYDVTVGIEHDFGALAPGAAVDVEVRIRWGFGAIDAILPAAMVVDAGPDRTVECEGSNGTDVTLAATASDAAASGWSWSVDGVAVGAAQDVVATLLPGRHVVAASAVDAQGRVASDEAVIEVEDTLPPIVAVGRAPRLWPPDHRMVRAAIPATATDACSDGVAISVLGVESDEPADRLGDGNTSPDWRIDADGSLWLRRERSGTGDGRTYTVRCVAVDGSGNTAPFDVRFDVPHDMGIAR